MNFSLIFEELQIEIGTISRLIGPAFAMLLVLMFTDYISGVLAAKYEGRKYPNNKKYGLNSKKGMTGIYKKIGYVLTIFVSICMDLIIGKYIRNLGITFNDKALFGLMVTLWFDVNEIISIIENIGRMGVKLPKKLINTISELKNNIDSM